MLNRNFVFAILLLSVAGAAMGGDLKFEHLSVEQGLSQSTVRCILQDRRGFLWIGTHDGLNRYDGRGFRVFRHDPDDTTSLSNNYVIAIVEDRRGYLWLATRTELNRFDPATERFSHYEHVPTDASSGVANNEIHSLCLDRSGILWIGTYGGLARLDIEQNQLSRVKFLPPNHQTLRHNRIVALCEDRHGRLWVGTQAGLYISSPDKKDFRFHDLTDAAFDGLQNIVMCFYQAQNGEMWLCTFDAGLLQYDPDSGRRRRYIHEAGNPNSLSANCVYFMAEVRRDRFWIGTQNGLTIFDAQQKSFKQYHHDDADAFSLNYNELWSFFRDRTGTCWVGTNGGGLNKHTPMAERFTHVLVQPHEPNSIAANSVMSFCEDSSGALWVGTDSGLHRWNPLKQKWQRFQHDSDNPRSMNAGEVMAVYEDRSGTIWVGLQDGGFGKLIRKEMALNKTGEIAVEFERFVNDSKNPKSLSNNTVFTIYEDRDGILWIGTFGGGLNRFDRQTKTFFSYKHEPNDSNSISGNAIEAIFEDSRGMLWVGTYDGGLSCLDRRAQKFQRYQYDRRNPQSLSSNHVTCFHEDRAGNLWIGTAEGLNKLDVTRRHFTKYFEKDGLANSYLYGILEDDDANLWLSTNKGLSRFNPASGEFKNFSVADGLQGNEFNGGAYYKSKNGEMFFGGLNGFNRFFPQAIIDNPHVPPIVLIDFQVFNRMVLINVLGAANTTGLPRLAKSISATEELRLSYQHSVFSFEFAALDYWAPEKNRYSYKMEGFDAEWIAAGTKNSATYTNLNPGQYVFRVRGANCDGVWNEQGAAVKLTIAPPFWMTWWFRGLGLAAATGLLALLHHYRVQRLLELDRLRVRLASDLHDDLGSTLNAIAMKAEMMQGGMAPEENAQQLTQISRMCREMINALRDVVWSIDARRDRMMDLLDHMREFAEAALAGKNIELRFITTELDVEKRLPIHLRQNLYLIFKEAVNNALKYAEATQLTVEMSNGSKIFQMKISDNGKGSAEASRRHGNGLRNMKLRAENIGAQVEYENNGGFAVLLKRPAL